MAEDVVIARFRAELTDVTKQFDQYIASLDKVEKEEKDVEKQSKKTTDTIKKGATERTTAVNKEASSFQSAFTKIKGSIVGIGAGIAAAFSIQAIAQFSKASIEAFLEQEKSIEQLRFAVINLGGESEAVFERLIRQSNEIQKISIFGDDAIQNAQAALASFGLTGRQIEQLIPKLADFATVTGVNITDAAQKVGAGLQGAGREFKKFGIDVSATNTPMENLTRIMTGLSGQAGAAEARTKTLAGQLEQLRNRSGDLQDEIGSKLAPSFVKLKVAIFEATLGLLGFNKAADAQKETTISQLERSYSLTAKRIIASGKDLQEEFGRTIESILSQNKATESEIALLEKKWGSNIVKVKILKEEIELNNQRVTALRSVLAATNAINEEQSRTTLTSEQVRIKSLNELNLLLEDNKRRNDIIAQSNVKIIEEELKMREKQSEDLRKLREKQLEERKKQEEAEFELFKRSLDKELDALESFIDRQKAKAKELDELLEFDIKFKAQTDGAEIAFLEARQRLFELYQQEIISAEVESSETVEEANAKKQRSYEKYIERLEALLSELGVTEIYELENTTRSLEQVLIESAERVSMALNSISDLYDAFSQRRINQINEVKEAQITSINDQLDANEDALNKRRISESEAANNEKKLLEEKERLEKEAQQKIRAEKRKAAILDRTAALAQIAIATAKNSVEQPGPLGALVPYWIALGALQASTVLAQPIPYRKGTKGAKGGLSLVGEEGPEMMMMPKDAKVVPAKQTNKYSGVFDSIIDDKFDDYVFKHYVSPELEKQRREFEEKKSKTFADNISKSMVLNMATGGKGDFYLEKMSRNGMAITPESAELIGSVIARYINSDPYRR
jgi:hypothetical protein